MADPIHNLRKLLLRNGCCNAGADVAGKDAEAEAIQFLPAPAIESPTRQNSYCRQNGTLALPMGQTRLFLQAVQAWACHTAPMCPALRMNAPCATSLPVVPRAAR